MSSNSGAGSKQHVQQRCGLNNLTAVVAAVLVGFAVLSSFTIVVTNSQQQQLRTRSSVARAAAAAAAAAASTSEADEVNDEQPVKPSDDEDVASRRQDPAENETNGNGKTSLNLYRI